MSGTADDFLPALSRAARDMAFERLPPEVVAMAKQCLLDWLGCAIAGSVDPLVEILIADALDGGEVGPAALVGRSERTGLLSAILINGAAGHALDYDDSNTLIMGHPTAPLAPVVLALGGARGSRGKAVLEAFVAGYETSATVGRLMTARHYKAGFHSTATLGAFGAAAAGGRLLGLDEAGLGAAFGLAGTRAAGLRASFGTMAKPLHAGHAAWVGASAARWAARGFTAAPDIFADPRGFPASHVAEPRFEAALGPLPGGWAILNNRFKWHAACHGTHCIIDAVSELREAQALAPERVRGVALRLPANARTVCGIEAPSTGLESKFSLRMMAAFALADVDTASPASFSDANARDPALNALRERVTVIYDPDMEAGGEAVIELADGRTFARTTDPLRDPIDIAAQARRARGKFESLATPVLGAAAAREVADQVLALEGVEDVGVVVRAVTPVRESASAASR